jgi:surface polysaccharide O-acyltransferase-like enzyme
MGRSDDRLNFGIEVGRILALFGVVTLHGASLGLYATAPVFGYIADTASRFAVPLFFLMAGWFWKDSQLRDPATASKRLLRRVGLPYAFWFLVYVALDVTAVLYPSTSEMSLKSYLLFPISGGPGFHLWFLPALFMGTTLSWFGLRRVGTRLTFAASFMLYLCGVAMWYYLAAFRPETNPVLFRNGLFFAPLFLVGGHLLRGRLPSYGLSLGLALTGAVLHGVEGYMIGQYPLGHDLSVGTVPFAVGMFSLFVRGFKDRSSVAALGKDVFGGYLLHLLILMAVANQFEIHNLATASYCVVVTFILSMALSHLLNMTPILRRVVS